MKKPELRDYNLSEDDAEKLQIQNKEYDKAFSKLLFECDEYNKFINKVAAIPTIIVTVIMMVLWYRLNNYHEGSAIVVLLFIAFVICYPILVCKYCKKDYLKDPRSNIYNYVDKDLEYRINQFVIDTEKYNEYCNRLKISFWQNLSGFEFEQEVAKLYKKMGYEAYVTKATGDGGIDIVLKKDNKLVAVQCKHHMSKVGPNDVRALIGVIASISNKYDYGIFVSLNGFTPSVSEELRKSKIKIELVCLSDLLKMAE